VSQEKVAQQPSHHHQLSQQLSQQPQASQEHRLEGGVSMLPPPEGGGWFYATTSGDQLGPCCVEEIASRWGVDVDETCYVWKDGLADWTAMNHLPHLMADIDIAWRSLNQQQQHPQPAAEGFGVIEGQPMQSAGGWNDVNTSGDWQSQLQQPAGMVASGWNTGSQGRPVQQAPNSGQYGSQPFSE